MEEKQERMFPLCNIEWNRDTGIVFWYTERSGGIERDWTGVPRMFETVGALALTWIVRNTKIIKLD
ncbi:Neuferricin [Temnothorax longispinosus]|uniref:Neuferricin n=1 Tax=Temnothorax longispinosus TaxID=300112 RepID=A0A4S2KHD6_9HYME|nr:Neuferricin [Temnothorax longispinosus]